MPDYNNGPLRSCKLSEINTGKVITGSDACRPGRPCQMTADKFKLHYVVHYMHRGFWDELVPEENEEELGKIEAYHCNMCPRRFRNNHNRQSYPGRGSMVCHLATEHGQLLKAMRNDDKVDMQSEIDMINEAEKGNFLELGIPDVPDNELYQAKESFMWKIEQEKKMEDAAKKKEEEPKKEQQPTPNKSTGEPRIVPFSKTELAEMRMSQPNSNSNRPKVFECPHCDDCKSNMDPSKLRLHIFLHYKDRWEHRLDNLEKGPNYIYCDMCPKRKQLKGANEEGTRMSAICHFAIQHHELRAVLNKDERLPTNLVSDLYYDIDLKDGALGETKSAGNASSSPIKPEVTKTTEAAKKPAKIPEPSRARRTKSSQKEKDAWMSSDEEKEEEMIRKKPNAKEKTTKTPAAKKKKN